VGLISLPWYLSRSSRERLIPAEQDGTAKTLEIRATGDQLTPIANLRRPNTQTTPSAPIIDEISIEKDEVCEGEENLIRVKAHTTDGSDALLHYVIGGERGQSVPLRTNLLPDGRPMHYTIAVFGREGISTIVDLPPYVVKRCRPERTLLINYRPKANLTDEMGFTAKLVQSEVNEAAFHPVRYVWDFGDGVTSTTSEPFINHSYARREQMQMYSDYLVLVEAQPQLGPSVFGRTSLQFLNLAFQDLQKFGIVSLVAQGTPRFPLLSERGVVRQRFKIWHYYNQPVEIQRIALLRLDMQGVRHDDGKHADIALLSQTEIPVGESIDVDLSFDTQRYSDTLALVYKFEGTSADGKPAMGEVPVMKPPPKPTRENSTPVRDPAVAAKIKKALRILGRDTVSQEDIWQLEREGKLQQ